MAASEHILVDQLLSWLDEDSVEDSRQLASWPRETAIQRRRLVQALLNLRHPRPVPAEIMQAQNQLLA
ncbi:MAG: hypothetical protein Q4D79_13940, partial [Propionibacteriaceae bacterium]|nr:hypothetical protein [Propionibacteriaceae bacterium]